MTTVLYILLAIVVLLVLITVHEFGHYVAGKILGFKINEFSIGFGPALFKREKKDGELFAIRAFPLGGYCAFEGEDEDGKEVKGSFNSMKPWKRVIVLLSGVTFNFLFGILFAAIFLMYSGFATVQVNSVVSQGGIEPINFKKNDVVVAVDGKTVEAYRTFDMLIKGYKEGDEFVVTVERDGTVKDITVKKQKLDPFYFVANPSFFEGKLFVKTGLGNNFAALSVEDFQTNVMKISTAGHEQSENGRYDELLTDYLATVYTSAEGTKTYADEEFSWLVDGNSENAAVIAFSGGGVSVGIIQTYVGKDYGFFESLGKAWPYSFYLCGLILDALGGLFTGATPLAEMGGTITAVTQIAEISQMSLSHFLLLIPLLAMNLAVFNILPFPSLDGARTLFVVWEWIFKKPVNRKLEGIIHTVGLFLLLTVVVFFDIYHFFIAARLLL